MATKAEIVAYYTNLIIMQYKDKPKASAHVALVVGLGLLDMLPFEVMNAYDLDTAYGYQLDVIGKYQNVSRTGYTFTKQVTLNDANFKTLIQMAIIKNNSGSSLYDIDNLMYRYFGSSFKVYDYGNMRIGYLMNSSVGSTDLAEMLITQGLLPKPMAVSLSSTIRYPDLDHFFGYSTALGGVNPNNSPYNTALDYRLDRPWISYKMIVGRPQQLNAFITTELVGQKLNQEDNGHLMA